MTRHAYSSGALALLCLIASSHLAACSGGDTTQTEDMKTSPGMDSAPDAATLGALQEESPKSKVWSLWNWFYQHLGGYLY